MDKKTYIELTHQAILGQINMDDFEQRKERDEKIYYAPYLAYRPVLFPDKNYGFRDTMIKNIKDITLDIGISSRLPLFDSLQRETAAIFLENYPLDTIQLQIPDSLKDVYTYYTEDIDIVNSTSPIWFFSPLLPTKEKDVFLIQIYGFFTFGDPGYMRRMQYRKFNRYKIKDGKVEEFDPILYQIYSVD